MSESPQAGAALTSAELRRWMRRSRLIVTPLIDPQIQSNSLDLRLGSMFLVDRRARQTVLDPLEVTEQKARGLKEYYELPFSKPFILHPSQLVLACSLEYLSIPPELSASVVTRSTYGRAGLISATAVYVHPGYKGVLTFELLNLGEVPIKLFPGLRVAQLVFHRCVPESAGSVPKYALATKPEFPKMWEDEDRLILKKVHSNLNLDDEASN